MSNAMVLPRGMFPGGNTGQGGLTAHAGGGQSLAVQLPALVNEVSTVGSASDSVLLPSAVPGAVVWVNNTAAANTMKVIGQATNAARLDDPTIGDVIIPANSSTPAATGTGVDQAVNTLAVYVCYTVGVWKQGLMVS